MRQYGAPEWSVDAYELIWRACDSFELLLDGPSKSCAQSLLPLLVPRYRVLKLQLGYSTEGNGVGHQLFPDLESSSASIVFQSTTSVGFFWCAFSLCSSSSAWTAVRGGSYPASIMLSHNASKSSIRSGRGKFLAASIRFVSMSEV